LGITCEKKNENKIINEIQEQVGESWKDFLQGCQKIGIGFKRRRYPLI